MAVRHPVRSSVALVALVLGLVTASCGLGDDTDASPPEQTTAPTGSSSTTTTGLDPCDAVPLEATEVGVSADEITIFVMADVGSPLGSGLFQGAIDAVKAWGDAVNEQGGVACREVVVREWDSRLRADDTTNGTLEACERAFAMVGTTSLLVLDTSNLAGCPDKKGAPTGIPDIAQLATELAHQCNPTTYPIYLAAAPCPYTGGPRESTQFVGADRYFLSQVPDLHGIFLIPGETPSAIQTSIVGVRASESIGVVNDGEFKISGRDDGATFTRVVEHLLQKRSNMVHSSADDTAMVELRKEAAEQGVDTVAVWSCQLSCYTSRFLDDGGDDVEGTYVWTPFLPFDEGATNAELQAYLDAVGGIDEASPWGAAAWAAAVEFKQVIDGIVDADGPNAITRARFLTELAALDDFDANGWFGPRDQRRLSDCFVLMQAQGGVFVRVLPTERGTLACDPAYLQTVTVDPTTAFVG
jgi:hypothetical protein